MPTNPIDDCQIGNDGVPAAVQPLPTGVKPGAAIQVRGHRWRLDQAVPRTNCCELHLSRESGAVRRVLLWPFDRPVAAARPGPMAVVRLRTWSRAIVAAAARTIGPCTPRGGIVVDSGPAGRSTTAEVLPYQLEPAIAVAGGAARILLADEVGLGKTVQAGWIVADLLERERDVRVLVAVPAGVRPQWAAELAAFFAIEAVTIDAAWLRRRVADVPADVSPWAAPGIYLGSIDFLKRPDVATALQAHVWDLLVVDEAHAAAAPTERYAALSGVAARARRVVAITATPYSGDPAAFASMTSLGHAPGAAPMLMFRRSREDVGDPRRRRHRFAPVRITRVEFRLQRLLERYSRDVWREAPAEADGARLAVTILRKRALSSPAAAARSLQRRLALLQGAVAVPRQLTLFDDEEAGDDELPHAALAAPGLADAAREHRWLAALIDAARDATPHDSKLRSLLRLLQRVRPEPAIVFTEYRDTLWHLAGSLPAAWHLHGGMTAGERSAVQRAFNERGGLLLATDAASEGLNLQQRCRLVVNFELPWNPARLEQRIGRVDRIGQRRIVHAITLVARDTAEDLVVANLTKRLARVAATLGERDRLAAFLGDARMARSVIGGAQPEITSDEPVAPAATSGLSPAPSLRDEAVAAATQLRHRLRRDGEPDTVAVASMRAASPLTPGYVIAIRCAAQTADGYVAAERVILLHRAAAAAGPRTAEDARIDARRAIGLVLPHVDEALPDLARWFKEIEKLHADAIDARLAREAALQIRSETVRQIQPSLFDRRAVRAADRLADLEAALQAEHRERIRRLESERRLQLTATPAGVLIVWR